jgi:tellurite resistance protein
MTDAGHRLRESIIASRNAWLVRAIDSTIDAEERAALEETIELLERLADANP